jgi:hypothetical protein
VADVPAILLVAAARPGMAGPGVARRHPRPAKLAPAPRRGNDGELLIVGICQRGLDFIRDAHDLALAGVLAGQHLSSTRACHDLFVVVAGE